MTWTCNTPAGVSPGSSPGSSGMKGTFRTLRRPPGGRLSVRKVPFIPEDPGDEPGLTPAGVLHVHVMVEFEGEQAHVREGPGQVAVPAAEVGGVTERTRLSEQVGRPLKTEAKGR